MIQIDNSMLQDILSCSTRAWVKYVCKKQMRVQDTKASERMQVGTLFHKLFERVLKREEERLDQIAHICMFTQWYSETFPEGVTQDKYTLENLSVIAQVWLRDLSTYFRDYDVLTTEQTLTMPLSPDVVFFGTPDAILENEHGIWIVDNKTTGWLSEEKKKFWARGSQGMGYWELVRAHYGKEPRGVLWNALEIGKIPPYDGNLMKKCAKHSVKYQECQGLHVSKMMIGPVTYTREQLATWRANAIKGAEKFEVLVGTPEYFFPDVAMEGMFSYPGCSQCQFTDWCWGGRNVGLMDSMMEAHEWPQRENQD